MSPTQGGILIKATKQGALKVPLQHFLLFNYLSKTFHDATHLRFAFQNYS